MEDPRKSVFYALFQGRVVQARLRPKTIYIHWDEDEEELPFNGSLKIYFDPTVITQHPYIVDDAFFAQSIETFINKTFGVDVGLTYSEAGQQGEDFVDFDIDNSEQLFCRIPDHGLNVYITQDYNKYRQA